MKMGIFLLGAALGGCAGLGPKVPILTPRALSQSEADLVRSGIRSAIKDPDSARFGDMIAGVDPKAKPPESIVVCGYVNSRNGFGGYTGPQPFIGNLENGHFIAIGIQGDDKYGNNAVTMTCQEYGLHVESIRPAV